MVMIFHRRVVSTEHMDLRRRYAGRLQLFFKNLQIVEVVAYEVVPLQIHGSLPLSRHPGQDFGLLSAAHAT